MLMLAAILLSMIALSIGGRESEEEREKRREGEGRVISS